MPSPPTSHANFTPTALHFKMCLKILAVPCTNWLKFRLRITIALCPIIYTKFQCWIFQFPLELPYKTPVFFVCQFILRPQGVYFSSDIPWKCPPAALLAPCLRFSSNPPPPTAIFPPPPLPPICRISPFAPGLLPSHPALHLHLQPNKPFSVPSLIGKKTHSLHCKCCTLHCVALW